MPHEKTSSSPDLIEKYRREMMTMYRRQTPSEEDDWLDRRFPEPNTERYRLAVAQPAPPPVAVSPAPPPITETPFVGYLRVAVFTADGAEPLEGALITVSRDQIVYASTATDRDGYTQVIPLPSVDPSLTLTPGNDTPYVTYDVLVRMSGYESVLHTNLPVYGNNYVTQPMALRPLLPGESPDALRRIENGGPTNL